MTERATMLGMVAFGRYLGLVLLVCSLLGCRSPADKLLARPGLREHLEFTTVLGREIHRRDKLTWWAGQVAHATLSPEQQESVVGWVVDVDNSDTDVLFFDDAGNVGLVVHCDGSGPQGCHAEVPSSPMSLSERNQAQYRAVMTAWAHPSFEQTSEIYNPVVIPAGAGPDVDWWVYLVALNPNPNIVVLGQHWRFVVDASGQTVELFRPFAEGGVEIDIGAMDIPDGAQVLSMSVGHVLDEVPTEMHVWAAITYELELVVATDPESKRPTMPMLWKVDSNGTIGTFD